MSCEDGRWMEVDQFRLQYFAVLILRRLLLEYYSLFRGTLHCSEELPTVFLCLDLF
jgi:hypothetical protein